jgi:tRNA threonylcarbamoyl adenosine modification protein YeaZ
MRLLVIDTSTGTSVAMVDGAAVLVERTVTDTRSHSEVIGTLLTEVLATAGDGVDGVVVGLGPGPFTGLRVGIVAGITFAAGRGIPVFGIPSHDVGRLADSPVVIATDARRKEWAWTSFADGRAVTEPVLTPAHEFEGLTEWNGVPLRFVSSISAADLGIAAQRRRDAGDDLSSLTPLYGRAPDAIPSAGPKRVTQ